MGFLRVSVELPVVPELVQVVPELVHVMPELVHVMPELVHVMPELVQVVPELVHVMPELVPELYVHHQCKIQFESGVAAFFLLHPYYSLQ